jgi:hypothetical protein
MAVLTAQPIYKVYQADAKNNRQEAPGTGNTGGGSGSIVGADGSTSVSGNVGQATGIKTMQPGSQPSGSNVGTKVLSQKVIQQASSTMSIAANGGSTAASPGFKASTIAAADAADTKSGSNSLQNDVSTMAKANGSSQTSVPTNASGVGPAAGLSQSPEVQ